MERNTKGKQTLKKVTGWKKCKKKTHSGRRLRLEKEKPEALPLYKVQRKRALVIQST